MPGIHELMREVPPLTFLIMAGLPFVMAGVAVLVGWYARAKARERAAQGVPTRGGVNDPFYAGLTMAVVPFAFGVMMLWGRFG